MIATEARAHQRHPETVSIIKDRGFVMFIEEVDRRLRSAYLS
jgi:hypothetical protein